MGKNITLPDFTKTRDHQTLKVVPSIALRIPTANNFTRDQRALENGGFFFTTGWRGKSSFLRNECGDLYLFSVVLN